eukprot:617865-Amphidinium_carterae.1
MRRVWPLLTTWCHGTPRAPLRLRPPTPSHDTIAPLLDRVDLCGQTPARHLVVPWLLHSELTQGVV